VEFCRARSHLRRAIVMDDTLLQAARSGGNLAGMDPLG
jgi:hypothetical protein